MPKPSVYIPEIVQEIKDFYGPLLDYSVFKGKIRRHLDQLAKRLHEGLLEGQRCAYTEVNNYHPQFLGQTVATLEQLEFNLESARHTIAAEFGFKSWPDLMELDPEYDPRFEFAVFLLLEGALSELKDHISNYPELLAARSSYGHQAMLLHYAANNGVEIFRQVVPINLPDITKFLINSGADKKATMSVYGGHHTALFLAESSAHPYDAGIAEQLLSTLR